MNNNSNNNSNNNNNNNNNNNEITIIIIINTVRASAGNVDRGRSRRRAVLGSITKQELACNYREHIARQLRTQYVDGINSNLMTFESRLRIIQSYWKLNRSYTTYYLTLKCW